MDALTRIGDDVAGMKSPEELEALEPADLFSFFKDDAAEEQP